MSITLPATPPTVIGQCVRLRPGRPFAERVEGLVGVVIAVWEIGRRDSETGRYDTVYLVRFPVKRGGELAVTSTFNFPREWEVVSA